MSVAATPETLVCDTSYVGRSAQAEWVASWPEAVRVRLDHAILAISIVTLMETRAGWLYAGWGSRRIARAEARLGAFLAIPLDLDTIERCAELKADGKRRGWNLTDNDTWIMATALSRRLPLVTADKDQQVLTNHGIDVIYLP